LRRAAGHAPRECSEHGPKQLVGYDTVETLVFERPRLWVRVRKYAKYVCPSQPECGVTQAQRPAGLVEGDRYDPRVAAEVIADKYAYHSTLYREQDRFAGSGWTPSRSTLVNLLTASAFVLEPLADYLRRLLLADGGLGCDDTRVTLIVPPIPPPLDLADPRSSRIHEVLTEAIEQGRPSVTARMWAYRSFALPINVFDFTVSRRASDAAYPRSPTGPDADPRLPRHPADPRRAAQERSGPGRRLSAQPLGTAGNLRPGRPLSDRQQ
jgi:transposase